MFSKFRKPAAVLLVITLVLMMMPVQADTIETADLLGTITGETYENSFLGIGCRLEGWHYYTDEEIEETNQITMENLAAEIRKLASENIAVMVAETADSLQNVNIQLRNVAQYTSVYNEVGLVSIAQSSLDQFKESLEASGMNDVDTHLDSVNISGEDIPGIGGSYTLSSYPIYFMQLWILRGDFLVYLTATTILEDQTEEVLSHFYLLP
ncbi:MAG: hypothetical protein IKQ45_05390 [Clostridia bacterium]|nr:hypothetical protein [Clostridia bacterium]